MGVHSSILRFKRTPDIRELLHLLQPSLISQRAPYFVALPRFSPVSEPSAVTPARVIPFSLVLILLVSVGL